MDLQDIINRMQQPRPIRYPRMRWNWLIPVVVVVLVAAGLASSIYTVPTDSAGVVQRFGRYSRTTEPGIHLKFPLGIEEAVAVPVKKVQKEEFGFRTLEAGVDSRYLGADEIEGRRVNSEDLIWLIRGSGERVSRGATQQLAEKAK